MENSENFLTCPNCDKQLYTARILPCGESVCEACVLNNEDPHFFNCKFCKQLHPIPQDGFSINKYLTKLIKSFDSKLYRGLLHQQLKQTILNVEEIQQNFNNDLVFGKEHVHKYCVELINEIDLSTENQIKELQNSRDILIKQVLNYEKECFDNFEMNHESIRVHQIYVDESKIVIDNEKSYLKRINFEEDKLKDKINRVKQVEWRLRGEKRKFKNLLFKNLDLIFVPNNLFTNVGRIEKINNFEIDFNNFYEIDLNENLSSKPDKYYQIGVERMSNGNFVFDYVEEERKNWVVEIHCFREEKNYFRCLKESLNDHLNYTRFKSFENKLIFYVSLNSYKYLKVCDENLKTLAHKICPYHIESIIATNDRILCLLDKELDSKIVVYDWNLKELMTVNENSMFLHFPKFIKNFYSNDEYFLFREIDNVNILNKQDGRLVKGFGLAKYFDILTVDSKSLIVRDPSQDKFEVLDFNGNLIETKELTNFPKIDFKTFLDENGNFCFVDCKNFKLYQ